MGVAILVGDWRRRKEKNMDMSEAGGQWETQPESEMVPAYCTGSGCSITGLAIRACSSSSETGKNASGERGALRNSNSSCLSAEGIQKDAK